MIYDLTVADLLTWEAWPDEMKRIARAAVAEEGDSPFSDYVDNVRAEALDDQRVIDEKRFGEVRASLADVSKKLKEAKEQTDPNHRASERDRLDAIDASLTAAIEIIGALPARLDEIDA